MAFLFFVILWFGLAVIIALAASGRGRNPLLWFLLPLFITPMLAALLLLFSGPGTPAGTQICPRCKEAVKVGALICRFCGYDLPEPPQDAFFANMRPCPKCGYQVRKKEKRCPRCSTMLAESGDTI